MAKDDAVDVETSTTKEAGILIMAECEQSTTTQLDAPALEPGEVAGLLYCVGNISKKVSSIGKQKVPHMLYERLKWVIRSPPEHPICSLSVSVSSSGYKANGLRPPSP